MPRYLRCLHALRSDRVEWVSCTFLAQRLSVDPTLVRKDLALTGITGKPKVGYYLPDLIAAVERFIGWDNPEDAFLVGVGHLGTALLGFEGFTRHGLNIVAGFDNDPDKIGTQIADKPILDASKLPDLAQRMHIRIGIITVGARNAQKVADLMLSGGIEAIWNFAPTPLDLPEGIILENEDLSGTLAVISRRLAARAGGQN
jgi:redox-sensing transcriptional repressor